MEQTYAQLVDYLSQSQNRNHEDGVETITKPIPDSDVSGDLDSRVLAVIKDYAAAESEPTFDLASARASMGWPNRDVTTTDITTDHVTIPSPDGDIPARLYRPRTEEMLPAIVFFHGGDGPVAKRLVYGRRPSGHELVR